MYYSGISLYDHLVITKTFLSPKRKTRVYFLKKVPRSYDHPVNTTTPLIRPIWPNGGPINGVPLYY